ncbi:hypothetical protein BP6252_07674 [Coleophoma cylindrospora]|uniref:PHD-type domain-containing protein n=1 Tax=Coleophoma cylindrospora TaxID=1849047 RepID=A0A3D8RB54_9HELO|nr:hypothetical protein BP6252_07674 [Coleophoma cylindrospora]
MPATTASMDVPLETTSPRRKEQIAEALQNLPSMNHSMGPLNMPMGPDAQATITDFLDFTEYLPSDMIRSLTLVGNLDRGHSKASVLSQDLLKTYAMLPGLPVDDRPKPLKLREDVSENINEAVRSRNLSHAEASRMAESVDRHLARAITINAKLQAMLENYPTSRNPSPEPQKSRSPQLSRITKPKITLRLDGSKQPENGGPKVRRRRVPRITVPGEVLAPYELDYDSYGTDTGISSDDERTPRTTPGRSLGGPVIKLKINNNRAPKQQKVPKPPRPPRQPGMGTNVHSAVAGISTSNALAKLKPPPDDAVPGSPDAPWLQLTAWELAKLRKRMKKNAVWSPSDTMISRELKTLGRGIEAYRAAKQQADASGETLEHAIQPLIDGDDGTRVYNEGAISMDTLEKDEVQLSNRGMKLNEAKKLKRENQAKELAKQAAEEAEQSARKMAKAAAAVKDLFGDSDPANEKKGLAKTPKKSAPKKRKRGSEEPSGVIEPEQAETVETPKPVLPQAKKMKIETPIPVPQPMASTGTSIGTPTVESAPSVFSDGFPATEPTPAPAPSSPKKSSTPILPPGTVKKDTKKPQPIRTSQRQASAAPPTPAPEEPIVKRPSSARSNLSRPTSRGKAASLEPAAVVSRDRPRRASTVHNTPAPEPRQPANRRAKRPPPGTITGGAGIEGAKAVSKRNTAPKKKGSKRQKDENSGIVMEVMDEVDDEGNIIDPNEPRYCVCNRVSFGTMIGCESVDCEKEWFHLECVGLTDIPSRTTKWYCPDCRVKLNLGERGEVTARGKKK